MSCQRKSRSPEKQGSRPHLLQDFGNNTVSQKIRATQLTKWVHLQMGAFHASRISLLSLASDLGQLD